MSEAKEQAKVILWANSVRETLPGIDHLFHVPNGGKRDKVTAGQMVALGVKAGVPDLLLPYKSNGYFGLAAEMKTDDGVVSKKQQEWFSRFEAQGWKVCVWRSADEAINGLKGYLNGL